MGRLTWVQFEIQGVFEEIQYIQLGQVHSIVTGLKDGPIIEVLRTVLFIILGSIITCVYIYKHTCAQRSVNSQISLGQQVGHEQELGQQQHPVEGKPPSCHMLLF